MIINFMTDHQDKSPEILEKNVFLLEISPELQMAIKRTGSSTLNELLKFKVHELKKNFDFSYHNLIELNGILKAYNCKELLQEF